MADTDALVQRVSTLKNTIERNKGRREQLLKSKKQEIAALKEKFNVGSVKEGKALLEEKEERV